MDFFAKQLKTDAAMNSYQPRSAFMLQSSGLDAPVPKRVTLAMNFIQMCNQYTHPAGFMAGSSSGGLRAKIMEPELPGVQQQAFAFACKCLGDYFQGKETTHEQWDLYDGSNPFAPQKETHGASEVPGPDQAGGKTQGAE